MYLHVGNDIILNTDEIIGVFDMENTTVSKNGRTFLKKAQTDGVVINATDDLPKTYILTEHDGMKKVYISSISSQTLQKRYQLSKFAEE